LFNLSIQLDPIVDHRIMDPAINFRDARNPGKVATALADELVLVS
jgi:hypothetical protein